MNSKVKKSKTKIKFSKSNESVSIVYTPDGSIHGEYKQLHIAERNALMLSVKHGGVDIAIERKDIYVVGLKVKSGSTMPSISSGNKDPKKIKKKTR